MGRAPDMASVVCHISYCHEMSVCTRCLSARFAFCFLPVVNYPGVLTPAGLLHSLA